MSTSANSQAAEPASQVGEALVEMRDVRVESPSGEAILEGVSLSLAAGEILGVVGESGSGKTTATVMQTRCCWPPESWWG